MEKGKIKGLNSFKPKKTLHKDFFNEKKKIIGDVRKAIIKVADLFVDSLEVPNLKVKDIVFTGSLANYNWSTYSDVDIHILVDFSKLKVNKDLLSDYFAMKKQEWGDKHEELTIYGFPVEMYVQDTSEEHNASGQYSIMNNEWIVEPSEFENSSYDEEYVVDKSCSFIEDLLDIEEKFNEEDNKSEIRKLQTKAKNLFKSLKDKRAKGVKKNGEFDKDNIVYKVVRRNKFIQRYFALMNSFTNKLYQLG